MSRYTINSLLYRVKTDSIFRERFMSHREALLSEWEITEEEKTALLAWDMQKLNEQGAYLHSLVRVNRLLKEAAPR
jgi:aromatic-ring opening dioxygenase LigAB LigA subunit